MQVLGQAIHLLGLRWTEIIDTKDICLSYYLSKHLPDDLIKQIDNWTAEKAVIMNLDDLLKVLIALSSGHRRPKPLLYTLSYYISKNPNPLSPKQISSLLYALNHLNLPVETLLNKLSSDFRAQIEDLSNPSTVRTIALCMGQMKWRDEALLDSLCQWILRYIHICRPSDIAAYIITLANLAYTPTNSEELFNVCIPRFNSKQLKKSEWIDIVWSLALLEKASREQIVSVLDPPFIESAIHNEGINTGTSLKLLNIRAIANAFLSNAGQTFPQPLSKTSITENCGDLSLRNHVIKVLKKFLPFPKYLNVNVNTNMGFTVDAELIYDKHCKPLPIDVYTTSFGEVESIEPLPEGAQRLALMIWTYKDYTLGSHSLIGRNRLAVKLLNKKGYKVVQIPHYNIKSKNTLVQNINYFEKRIQETMKT